MAENAVENTDVTILGGGVAGLALAGSLTDRGVSVSVVDPEIGNEATELPVGMVNPAMGRRAKPGWQGEACWSALRARVEGLARWRGVDAPIQDGGILRPALTDERAELYQESIEKYDWQPDQLRWLSPEEVAKRAPHLPPVKGALLVVKGYAIHVRDYLGLYRDWLSSQGVRFLAQSATYEWNPGSDPVPIQLSGGETLESPFVIVACGSGSRKMPGWDFLPLHNVKGEMVIYRSQTSLPWTETVAGRGFMVCRGHNELIVGSNYDHHARNLTPSTQARSEIEAKLDDLIPSLSDQLEWVDQWAGFRITTPNRRPVAGFHPEWHSLGIFTGLNSRGLLYSERVGSLLADHLIDETPLPEELLPDRFR